MATGSRLVGRKLPTANTSQQLRKVGYGPRPRSGASDEQLIRCSMYDL